MNLHRNPSRIRVIPTHAALKGARLFDEIMEDALRRLLGGVLDSEMFKELQLPVNDKKDQPTFGVGLTSAANTAAAAFLASASLTKRLCDSFPGTRPNSPLSEDDEVLKSYEIYRGQCAPGKAIPLAELESDKTPSQKALVARVYEHAIAHLRKGDTRTQAFRASLSLPGSKDWLKCTPSPGLGTYIADRNFRIWFQYFCQVPLFRPDATCHRCNKPMDAFGDHLLWCPNGYPRGWRHDSHKLLLASDLQKAARHPIPEPRIPGTHGVRPDIKALGCNGGTDYYDVVFVHPITRPRTPVVLRNPSEPLSEARAEKIRHYANFMTTQGPSAQLVPIPLSTLGGWHPEAYAFVSRLAETVAAKNTVPVPYAKFTMFSRYAANLVRNNAVCLLEGLVTEV